MGRKKLNLSEDETKERRGKGVGVGERSDLRKIQCSRKN